VKARVLLNVDLGELPDEPEGLYACTHIANVACGGHAGDEHSMLRAVELCRTYATRLGAHPSYPDRQSFGRRPMTIDHDALRASVAEQCNRLAAVARRLGETIAFVKPHGALYHAAGSDSTVADALVDAANGSLGRDVVVIGPPRGALATAATRARQAYAPEGFADRAAREDGSLVPRDEPGALLLDPATAAARARELASVGDMATVCVHGDTPGALAIARAVRAALDAVAGAAGDGPWR
jgi:UPF0271 protein